jgi:hypothetical protein
MNHLIINIRDFRVSMVAPISIANGSPDFVINPYALPLLDLLPFAKTIQTLQSIETCWLLCARFNMRHVP